MKNTAGKINTGNAITAYAPKPIYGFSFPVVWGGQFMALRDVIAHLKQLGKPIANPFPQNRRMPIF